MSSAVTDLEAGLQAMLQLKPPGVSGSRIQSITALCTANVQSESALIQKLYTHFKKAPPSHKLGVLYVVDSVTRKWTEQAKNAGQPLNNSAQDGTFAAGVFKVTELLPVLMNDIIQTAPDDQKEKIKKLIEIWEKGMTFPLPMLNQFKDKLNTPSQNQSTTPPGSPPADLQKTFNMPPPAAQPAVVQPAAPAATGTSSILEALANMARQNTAAPPTSAPQNNSYNVSNAYNNPAQLAAAMNQAAPVLAFPPPVNVPAPPATFASQPQAQNNVPQNYASNQNPYAAVPPPPLVPAGALDPAMQQHILLIKGLADQGFSPDKIATILQTLGPNLGTGGLPPPPPQFAPQNQDHIAHNVQNGWGPRPDEARDRNGFQEREPVRSPPNRYRQRSRSRSPVRGWDARDSPGARRHAEQNFDYDRERNSPGQNRGDDRGRRGRGNDYRQRSPVRRQRSPTPPRSGGQKWVGHEPSIGKGNIKVLSRTLFVGGVTMPEQELRNIFEVYGRVQTCIVNKEKRHAFVKMISRADAVTAKESMEKNRAPDSQLRTRWGVGFGPRDCSDYQTGVSIIPINKLTDADRKWMLTAEYGGSGGKPIEGGMVVEEPDIEIGQGVSSKAISRRMQTDMGGNNGPKSTRERDEKDHGRNRRGDRDNHHNDRRDGGRGRDRENGVSAPPKMPPIPQFMGSNFPFNMNGMVPPGFIFPGQSQPPPPGH
ncbi:hypothetical protein B0J14DRAFT_702795 [Halenospora varia]|nr:hypothetical protein B0J14DRAFT_702795 [Halenospora varia]